ncbi:MAG: TraV family lipoprotein [Deltaproteobacteria bacterium]|nr:TraV family lipoprotein [Deltaproteobacteria bacterium]
MDYMPMIFRLSLCGMLGLLASCSASRPHAGTQGQSLEEVYAQARRQGGEAGAAAMRDDLQLQGTLGYVRPHVPVRTPPHVMRVWIPPFADAEQNLVQGHWVHVVIADEGWTVGQQASPVTALLPYTTAPTATPVPAGGGRR